MFTFLFSMLKAEQTSGVSSKPFGLESMGILAQILPFILIILIFYFFIIRPQNKQRQLLREMIENIKPGNKVITKGGLMGTVSQILENSLIIQLYDGNKVEILKDAVISLVNNKQ